MKSILVTGSAGFIGAHLVRRLLDESDQAIISGIDNLNSYYDLALKHDRLKMCGLSEVGQTETGPHISDDGRYRFFYADITDAAVISEIIKQMQPDIVVHLAAQAGIRYSLENPRAYIDTNISGFFNVLDACRLNGVQNLIYASTSSVYGEGGAEAFGELDETDAPLSLYAATKKSNEAIAASYASLYNMKLTGLRFFTVYGPWGRPDMAYYSFTKSITQSEPITLYADGMMKRDMTYIDDVVEGINRLIATYGLGGYEDLRTDYRDRFHHPVLNIGRGQPELVRDMLNILEREVGQRAVIVAKPAISAEASHTFANCNAFERLLQFKPGIDLKDGLSRFVRWYESYYS